MVGLVHMNGRVYDPTIGRFLSPDPNVQIPESTQGFNRYTYVNNNPLSYSDPSGFFFKKLLSAIGPLAQIAASFLPPPFNLIAVAVISAVSTLAQGGSFLDAVVSAGFSAAGALVGGIEVSALDGTVLTGIAGLGKALDGVAGAAFTVVAHGIVGGVQSLRGGGNFYGGLASGGLSSASGAVAGNLRSRVARTIVGAVVGGTASRLGGGKFANGAVTGAFVYYAVWTPSVQDVRETELYASGDRGGFGGMERVWVTLSNGVRRLLRGPIDQSFNEGTFLRPDEIRVRHYTYDSNLDGIEGTGAIMGSGRNEPLAVHVELAPFGRASTGGAETGGGRTAYIEFSVRTDLVTSNLNPISQSGRNLGFIKVDKNGFSLSGTRPTFQRITWWTKLVD